VVKYHGLARRYLTRLGLLMRPLLNGGTLGGRKQVSKDVARRLEAVRRILWETWDPIGVNDKPEASGEYDSYASTIVSLLARGCSASHMDVHLSRVETESMGLSERPSADRAAVVAELIALREGSSQPTVPLELLELETMASGEQSLRLTAKVPWEKFPAYATRVVDLLGGTIQDRADSPVERVWGVTVLGRPFWLSLDDFGLGISLDPRDPSAASLIPEIRSRLLAKRQEGFVTSADVNQSTRRPTSR